MALHHIIHRALDADYCMGDKNEALPKHPNDRVFEMVKDMAMEYQDVLILFKEKDDGDSDEDEPSVDNPVLGSGTLANFMLWNRNRNDTRCSLAPQRMVCRLPTGATRGPSLALIRLLCIWL